MTGILAASAFGLTEASKGTAVVKRVEKYMCICLDGGAHDHRVGFLYTTLFGGNPYEIGVGCSVNQYNDLTNTPTGAFGCATFQVIGH